MTRIDLQKILEKIEEKNSWGKTKFKEMVLDIITNDHKIETYDHHSSEDVLINTLILKNFMDNLKTSIGKNELKSQLLYLISQPIIKQ